ncbi:SMI1/KNR4 family protein [Burkholderia cepacia]|uniref:SMI1/KNR4 family protein n=1 Tax=Burkholderia cepacia TaxID=292 RepID=UPI00249DDC5D|nr:SMI1/KNR4 family protein [Burkholderia cepacia]WGY73164.1 SMI1/KNR4 family protein [Burkholderia cepacia]
MAKFSSLGECIAENGSALYGKCPRVGREAYLHTLYPPLAHDEIARLEQLVGRRLPQQLIDFYAECNGFHYFLDTLIVYGLRKRSGRSGGALLQPYDMRTPNVEERIRDADEDMVFFAWYDWDGSLAYTRCGDSSIYLCGSDSIRPLKQWDSLDDFLSSESERILGLFDSNGRLLDENASTLPAC